MVILCIRGEQSRDPQTDDDKETRRQGLIHTKASFKYKKSTAHTDL